MTLSLLQPKVAGPRQGASFSPQLRPDRSTARALIPTYTGGGEGGGGEGVHQVSRKINIVPRHCIKKQPTNKFIQVSKLYLYIFIYIFSSLKCLTQSSERRVGGGGEGERVRGHDPDPTPPLTEDAGMQTVVVFISDSTIFEPVTLPSPAPSLPRSLRPSLPPAQVNRPVLPASPSLPFPDLRGK